MNIQHIKIEIAKPAQFERLCVLVNDAYRGLSGQRGWTHEAEMLAGPRVSHAALSELAGQLTILVAVLDEQVVGCVSVQRIDDKEWYLSMLAVDPSAQSLGVGKLIMSAAEAHVQAVGARLMRISVINHRSALLDWYERRGYHKTGSAEPFPYHDPSVGQPLREDLALITLHKVIPAAV